MQSLTSCAALGLIGLTTICIWIQLSVFRLFIVWRILQVESCEQAKSARVRAVIIDGKLFVVTGADHNTPGNLRAKVQFKLRDVSKGTIMDKRVGATDDIDTTTLDSPQCGVSLQRQ